VAVAVARVVVVVLSISSAVLVAWVAVGALPPTTPPLPRCTLVPAVLLAAAVLRIALAAPRMVVLAVLVAVVDRH
jgi:hypothetical protein